MIVIMTKIIVMMGLATETKGTYATSGIAVHTFSKGSTDGFERKSATGERKKQIIRDYHTNRVYTLWIS